MKKVIVLSAVLMAATFSVTSCAKKTEAEPQTEVTEAPVADTTVQAEVDTTVATPETAAPDTTAVKQ